jgi:hypothetical protein
MGIAVQVGSMMTQPLPAPLVTALVRRDTNLRSPKPPSDQGTIIIANELINRAYGVVKPGGSRSSLPGSIFSGSAFDALISNLTFFNYDSPPNITLQ